MVPASFHDLIVVLYREHRQEIRRHDVSMLALLLVVSGLQMANAVQLDGHPHDMRGVSRQGALLIAFFPFGIARSWQLVGALKLSLSSTVAAVVHRPAGESLRLEETGQAGEGQ